MCAMVGMEVRTEKVTAGGCPFVRGFLAGGSGAYGNRAFSVGPIRETYVERGNGHVGVHRHKGTGRVPASYHHVN